MILRTLKKKKKVLQTKKHDAFSCFVFKISLFERFCICSYKHLRNVNYVITGKLVEPLFKKYLNFEKWDVN